MKQCAACSLEIRNGPRFTLPCNHAYHRNCLSRGFNFIVEICHICKHHLWKQLFEMISNEEWNEWTIVGIYEPEDDVLRVEFK